MLGALTEPAMPAVRGGVWAVRALRRLRKDIVSHGLDVEVLRPPTLARNGVRGVEVALRMRRATCLERSLIVQRWLAAHGERHDVLVGVAGGSSAIEAHAWLDAYDPREQAEGFQVLTRVASSD